MLNWEVMIDEAANRDLKPATPRSADRTSMTTQWFTTVSDKVHYSGRAAVHSPIPDRSQRSTGPTWLWRRRGLTPAYPAGAPPAGGCLSSACDSPVSHHDRRRLKTEMLDLVSGAVGPWTLLAMALCGAASDVASSR
jgi:hypothetical protein